MESEIKQITTNKPLFVAFERPSQPTIVKQFSDISGKTTNEISQDKALDLNNEFLAISTPLFREKLDPNAVPCDEYPQLVLSSRPAKFLTPDYFISILPKSDEKLFTIIVLVSEKNVPGIPPYEASFNPEDFRGESSQKLIEFIKEKFPFKAVESKLVIDDEEIDTSLSSYDLVKILRKKQMKIICTLDEKENAKIRHRVNIINEIQTTEITYIDGLKIIRDFWKPEMENLKMLTENESSLIFHDFPIIINCHQQFLDDLKKRGTNYDAMLSDVFLDFSSFFKVSLLYISNYSNIIQLILEKSKSKDFETKLKDLATKNSKDSLTAYLITPVQRMPRYILFLRELLKSTPPSHPDFAMLASAASKLEEVTKQIDSASVAAENNAKLLTIQNKLQGHFSVIHPSRIFISCTPILVKKPKTSSGNIYLFNDLVLITREGKGFEIFVFKKKLLKFKFIIKTKTKEFCIINSTKGKISFSFLDDKSSSNFVQKLNEIKEEAYTKEGVINKIFKFNISSFQPKSLFHKIYGHCSLQYDKNIYIFGGEKDGAYSSEIKIIHESEEEEVLDFKIGIPGRKYHAMAMITINNNLFIYIFGGMEGNDKYLNDFWLFDTKSKNCVQLKSNNSPEPRCGHTLTYYNNKLYLFGGRNKKNTFNDFWIYDIRARSWEQTACKNRYSPSPRAFMTADLVNERIVFHGGMYENQIYQDFYVFDLNRNQWIPANVVGDFITPRAMHKSIYIEPFIIYIGGKDSNGISEPAILDTNIMKYSIYKAGFNDPPTLTRFSANLISLKDEQKIFIYGGISNNDKIISSLIYTIEIPSSIQNIFNNYQKVLESKFEDQIQTGRNHHRKKRVRRGGKISSNHSTLSINTLQSSENMKIPMTTSQSNITIDYTLKRIGKDINSDPILLLQNDKNEKIESDNDENKLEKLQNSGKDENVTMVKNEKESLEIKSDKESNEEEHKKETELKKESNKEKPIEECEKMKLENEGGNEKKSEKEGEEEESEKEDDKAKSEKEDDKTESEKEDDKTESEKEDEEDESEKEDEDDEEESEKEDDEEESEKEDEEDESEKEDEDDEEESEKDDNLTESEKEDNKTESEKEDNEVEKSEKESDKEKPIKKIDEEPKEDNEIEKKQPNSSSRRVSSGNVSQFLQIIAERQKEEEEKKKQIEAIKRSSLGNNKALMSFLKKAQEQPKNQINSPPVLQPTKQNYNSVRPTPQKEEKYKLPPFEISKPDFESLYHELGIDPSTLVQFQVHVIERKLGVYHKTHETNKYMEQLLKKELDNIKSKLYDESNQTTQIFIKVYDNQQIHISKLQINTPFNEIKTQIETLIGHEISILYTLNNNEKVELNEDTYYLLAGLYLNNTINHFRLYTS